MDHLHLEAKHLLELMERRHDAPLGRLAAHLAEVCPPCRRALQELRRQEEGSESVARAAGGHLASEAFRQWLRADDDPLALHLALHQAALCRGCCTEAREAADLYAAGLLPQDFLIAEEDVSLARTRFQAPALVAELESLPPGPALAAVERDRRFHGWGLAELLCERSRENASADPDVALHLANLALAVAERVELAGQPEPCVEELKMLAFAHRGNALRVSEELRCAGEAFEKAERHWAAASIRAFPYRAEVLSLRLSFERYLQRYEDCFATAAEAVAEAKATQPKRHCLEARLLIKLAGVLSEVNEPARAVESAVEALSLIDAAAQPRLWLAAAQVQLFFLPELAAYDRAAQLLPEVDRMAREHGSRAERLKVEWATARIKRGTGQIEEAISMMRNVRQGFHELRLHLTAAVAALELATLYFHQGKLQHVRRLALELMPVFREAEIHREALAAFAIFQQAAVTEQLTDRLLADLVAYFRRAETNPTLRFEPTG